MPGQLLPRSARPAAAIAVAVPTGMRHTCRNGPCPLGCHVLKDIAAPDPDCFAWLRLRLRLDARTWTQQDRTGALQPLAARRHPKGSNPASQQVRPGEIRCRRCDARGSRPGPWAVEPLLTCTLTFQPLPSSLANRRPRTAWRRPGARGQGCQLVARHRPCGGVGLASSGLCCPRWDRGSARGMLEDDPAWP
jgi:hypothetical protein